jgi:hypothetical protein
MEIKAVSQGLRERITVKSSILGMNANGEEQESYDRVSIRQWLVEEVVDESLGIN